MWTAARLLGLMIVAALGAGLRPTSAAAGEQQRAVLLAEGPPAGGGLPSPLHDKMLEDVARGLERAGWRVLRRPQPRSTPPAGIEELLAQARSDSERFREDLALVRLAEAERRWRSSPHSLIARELLIRILLARAKLHADMGRAIELQTDLEQVLVLAPNMSLDIRVFPPSVIRLFRELQAKLPRAVSLTVKTVPARAPVWVDGQEKGSGPVTVQLVAGEHFVVAGPPEQRVGRAVEVGEAGASLTLKLPRPPSRTDGEWRAMGIQAGAQWVIIQRASQLGARPAAALRAVACRAASPSRSPVKEDTDAAGLTGAAFQLGTTLRGLAEARPALSPSALAAPVVAKAGPPRRSVFRSFWLWTAVAAVAAGSVTAAVLLAQESDPQIHLRIRR